jgi:hypothetical protein
MGCHAAINALKVARHIVRSEPDARVLVLKQPPPARLATRRQSAVNRGRAHRHHPGPYQRIKRQPAMPFHSGDENRQQRFQSLAAHPVGGFPKQDQCLANRLPIDSSAGPQCIPRTSPLRS